MKRTLFLRTLYTTLLLLAAELTTTGIVYPHLQATVPLHWDIHGQPNGYGPRIVLVLLGAGMLVFTGLLAAVLPWLSPKNFSIEEFAPTFWRINLYLLLFMFYLDCTMLWGAAGHGSSGRMIFCGIAMLIALLGNVMGKVRRNFYIGIRTPWTLSSERVWSATHRFAARAMFMTGVLGCIAAAAGALALAMALVLAGALAPIVYSLVYSKQLEHRGELEAETRETKGDL